jgi:hypothetical protein
MEFARIVFGCAGVWGLLALTPLYFLCGFFGRVYPPTVTHPQFYYGFTGVGLAWQIAFLVIASDPQRFRPVMLPSMFEKFSYTTALVVLFVQHRVETVQLISGSLDGLLGILFIAAFLKSRPQPAVARIAPRFADGLE